MPTDRESELELERLRIEDRREQRRADADSQQRKLAFWAAIITTILSGILGPILLTVFHADTRTKIGEVKTDVGEVKTDAKDAATHAEKAVQVTRTEAAKIDEKVDANLKQWKAYNTKEPEDMEKAAHALAKVEKGP